MQASDPEAATLAGQLFSGGESQDFTTLFVPRDRALRAAADPLSNQDILQARPAATLCTSQACRERHGLCSSCA